MRLTIRRFLRRLLSRSAGVALPVALFLAFTFAAIYPSAAYAHPGSAGAIELVESAATVASNIIAFGSSGVRSAGSVATLRNNCLFGNREFDYSGVRPGSGDIHADPRFGSARPSKDLDVRLRSTSPCIDVGDDEAVQPGWRDIHGEDRVLRGHVDIGADEAHSEARP